MTMAGLVLAAGAGVRFGGPKAPFVLDGLRLVDRSVQLLRGAGCAPVIVVLGAWVGEVPDAVVVINDNWPAGMGSSLRTGLAALEGSRDIDSVIVTLVDLPGLTADGVRRVCDCPAAIAAATFGGKRGHPVKLSRAHWAEALAAASGDEARAGSSTAEAMSHSSKSETLPMAGISTSGPADPAAMVGQGG